MNFVDFFASISIAIIFISIVLGILGFAVYILEIIFFYKLSKMEEVKNPWFALIPLISICNIFEMIKNDEIDFFSLFKLDKNTAMIIYLVYPFVVSSLLSGRLETIAAILFVLYTFIIYYNLLNEWNSPNTILYSILVTIISPLGIYLIYSERYKYRKNNDEIVCEYREIKEEIKTETKVEKSQLNNDVKTVEEDSGKV